MRRPTLRLGFQLRGTEAVRRELLRVAEEAPKAVAKALYRMGAVVWAEACIRAPLKYGALRHSGYVAPPDLRLKRPSVEVGFGVEYAVYQHEGDFQHPRGGQRKFLESALEDKAQLGQLADWAKSYLERGGSPSQVAPAAPTIQQRAQARAKRRRPKAG